MHIMCVKHLQVFFLIGFASMAQCFIDGYSKETCDTMIPNKKNIPVVIANSAVPYTFSMKSTHYRRNRELEIEIPSTNIEGFQFQIQKPMKTPNTKPVRVGEFVKWPEGAKPLHCDPGKATAVTHTSTKLKNNLKFKWRAPDKDEGQLKIFYSFVAADGVYWTDSFDTSLEFANLPLSVADCGKAKGCIRYSANKNKCDGNTCLYLLTYQKISQNTEFSLNALSKDQNSYSAVGFKKTEDGEIELTACIRENNQVSIKHYILKDKGKKSSMEKNVTFQDVGTDKEGENFWCQFTRPVKDADAKFLDLGKELYWIYTWGKVDKTSHKPIFGDKNWHQSKLSVGKAIDMIHYTGGSNSIAVNGFMFLTFFFLLIISQM